MEQWTNGWDDDGAVFEMLSEARAFGRACVLRLTATVWVA